MLNKIIDKKMELLLEVDKVIAACINKEFDTVINDFGVCHQSQPQFQMFSNGLDAGQFGYLNYFILPVDTEDNIILPKTFYSDTERFRDPTAWGEFSTKYERMAYYDNLKTFEQLANAIETRTAGAKVICRLMTSGPFNSSPDFLIPKVQELDDVGYLVAIFYSN